MTTKTTKKTTTKKATSKATPKKTTRANTAATVAKAKPNASTKATPAENATRANDTAKSAKPKRVSGLDLAAKVLAKATEPLQAKAIAERAIAAGWKTTGKTPHATLYAAMIREIAKKGKDSRFVKTDRGLFTANK
jgi:HB1/ASXL restriction endonuclease-like protein with HTH domain